MKRIRKFKKNIFNIDKLSDWAKKVKAKDSYQCFACGYRGYLHSHHIMPKGKYHQYAYSVWNGIALCKRCHIGKNGVHGKRTPRNDIVKQLRILMFSDNIVAVKKLSNNKGKVVNKSKPLSKFKKPYSRYVKRKLY